MAESSTIITLSQLCDIALNTTDVGVVNFNVLRGLLQVMIKQLGLLETKVEYRGPDSEKIQSYMTNAKPGTLALTAYSITPEKKDQPAQTGEQVVLIRSEAGPEAQFTITMSKEYFDNLEKTITTMQNQMKELQELPTNLKLFENMKEGGKTPVLDMFQILSVQKRMEAVEQSMEKMASMMENVLKGTNLSELTAVDKNAVVDNNAPDSNVINKIVQRIERLEAGAKDIKVNQKESKTSRVSRPSKGSKTSLEDNESLTDLKQDLVLMKELVGALTIAKADETDFKTALDTRLNTMETKYTDFEDQINSLDTGFSRLTTSLQERIEALEKEIGEILEKLTFMPHGGDGGGSSTITQEMQTQLLSLQEELQFVVENVKKITDQSAGKERTMDIVVEQIELLKTVKADREDLEDALADKADICQINRKVSYEQFDQACGDMTKTLEDAITRLTQQEILWTQALTNIQAEVGSKLDKNELNPLRDIINEKLKSLQEKFKALTAMKKEQEAAGTKTRFLRNINCISCDKDVVMRKNMDVSLTPQPHASPLPKGMGPYLAYELDQLRKQQKASHKNMNALENAFLTNRGAKSADHVCNRYCGGSHTVTTPHQRVTRLGHFLEQWGPEVGPVNETQIRGTDGKLYKGRDDEELRKLGEKVGTEGNSSPDTNKKSITVNTEQAPSAPSNQEVGNISAKTSTAKSEGK